MAAAAQKLVRVVAEDGTETFVVDDGDFEDVVDDEQEEDEDEDDEEERGDDDDARHKKVVITAYDSARDEADDNEEEEDDDDIANESLMDRIAALKDMVPVSRRRKISRSLSSVYSKGSLVATLAGRAAWVLATSAILIMLPLGIEIERDTMMAAYENEQKMQQQATQMLQPVAIDPNVFGAPNFAAAQQQRA